MKILCYVNHYFGEPVGFRGRSTDPDAEGRREIVSACLAHLRSLPGVEVYVCGIDGRSLEPIDIPFPHVRDNPTMLVYESLAHMAKRIDEGYDYFINIEDDILLPAVTLANLIEFDKESLLNEVLHPNRLEQDGAGTPYCVDMKALPGGTFQRRQYRGRELCVANSPHSALLLLSRDKLRYVLRHGDIEYRGRFLGVGMESALAYYHGPFCLYRSFEDLAFHTVTHLDPSPSSPGTP